MEFAVRNTSPIITVFWTLLLLIGAGRAEAQEAAVEDSFVSYDGPVTVTLALDQLGVVAGPDISEDAIEVLASENDFEIAQRVQGGYYVFQLANARTRAELVAFARDFRRTEPEISQAGMVGRTADGSSPLLFTDQFVVRLKEGQDQSDIADLNEQHGVEILMEDRSEAPFFLMTVTDQSDRDALDMANLYHEDTRVEYAEPNMVVVKDMRQTIPNDPLFNNQWHHQNTGQNGGTPDADLDTPKAWDITMGDPGTVIAVIDGGFDTGHADLAANLWQNPGEVAGDGQDNDGNGYVDDVNGWDFSTCGPDDDNDGRVDEDPVDGTDNDGDGQVDEDPRTPLTCGNSSLGGGSHGTSTSGAAAAEGDNGQGMTGTCPDCRVMLIRGGGRVTAGSIFEDRLAFQYALRHGADIISNSWGYDVGVPRTRTVVTAINLNARVGRFVLFAMTNAPYSADCQGSTPDISALQNVFAVSASSNLDTRAPSGYGDCMEMVGPTSEGRSAVGTLGAATIDVTGSGGYNRSSSSSCMIGSTSLTDLSNNDYTRCFGGTSFATPATAGVAGLLLSVNSNLTVTEVERLLQDTGDKIEDSRASYDTETGFSDPASGPTSGSPAASLHGWGRVNAFEAVQVANQGVDVFMRDNRLDWGNTEQPSGTRFESPRGFIPWWQSVDIKVDAKPYQSAPTTASDFAALQHENPISGQENRVYVRVRNRGPQDASSVSVELYWAFAGTGLPRWPSGWGSSQKIGQQTLSSVRYSGATVAGTSNDPAQILQYTWTAPSPQAGQPQSNHFCLLAKANPGSNDPGSGRTGPTSNLVPHDNNVTLRNLHVVNTSRSIPTDGFTQDFLIRNPRELAMDAKLSLELPEGWEASLENATRDEVIPLDPGEKLLATLHVFPPEEGANGTVSITQKATGGEGDDEIVGGMTYNFRTTEEDTPIESAESSLPATYKLIGNHPNPFTTETVIRYALPKRSEVQLTLYTLQGREVRTLVDRVEPAGRHQVTVQAEGLGSGLYIYRLEAGGESKSRIMSVVR